MDGAKAQFISNLADRILIFPNELLALLQLHIQQIVLGRRV